MNIKKLHLAALRRGPDFERFMSQQSQWVEWHAPHVVRPMIPRLVNFIVYGPPKSGKTTVANVLRKIWPAAGVKELATRRVPGTEIRNLCDMLFQATPKPNGIRVTIVKSRWHNVDQLKEFVVPWPR